MSENQTSKGVGFALIQSVQNGDVAAFGKLVAQCRRRVMATISRMIVRPEDVEDVAQEVFFRMHRSIGQLQNYAAFELWTYRLTTNATYDYLRTLPRRLEIRMSDMLEQQLDAANDSASCRSAREERERKETVEYVDNLLAQVSPDDRILLVIREVEGLSLRELAVVLGINFGALKILIFRAINRLRKVYEQQRRDQVYQTPISLWV
jgi:RNA polymerase sigma-70 factor (ECF subfamily)